MAKVIIGIHGLGNKPPRNLLKNWWQMAIEEGLRKWKNEIPAYSFELVYWADILHENPLDENCTDKEDPLFLDEKYLPSSGNYVPEDHSKRKKILDFLGREMNSIFLNDDFSLNYSFLTDAIVRHFFTDLDKYYKDTLDVKTSKNVKDLIRQRTAEMIRKHQKDEILVIAHSMGSIIAYDVLAFDIPDITIDTLITIGSPLGLPVVKSKIAAERKIKQKDTGQLAAPSNIKKHWFNFSDLEDKVAINYQLSDDYSENTSQVKPIDFEVHNDYEIDGEPNPHKSYGYLRTQEFSDKVYIFLTTKKPSFWKRIIKKIRQLLKLRTGTEY
ncbi:MAG TPA: hypothetical protein PK335_13925 [Draconibacterium sp.]|nr:hypothetical protein [Draconibacterium sp.]